MYISCDFTLFKSVLTDNVTMHHMACTINLSVNFVMKVATVESTIPQSKLIVAMVDILSNWTGSGAVEELEGLTPNRLP